MSEIDDTQPVELVSTVDIFAEELTRIERLGPNRRLIFTVRQSLDYDARVSKVVVVKLIVPAEAIATIAAHLLQVEQVELAPPVPIHEGRKH